MRDKLHYAGDIAEHYDARRANDPTWAAEQAMMDRELAALQAGTRVLDVGAGTGRYLALLHAAGAVAICVDASSDMLRQAQDKAKALSYPVTIVVADVTAPLSLPAADWMISTRLFNWVPLGAVQRVLEAARDAGVLHFVFSIRFIAREATPGQRLAVRLDYLQRNLRSRLGLRRRPIYHLPTEEQIARMLQGCGLTLVREVPIQSVGGGQRYCGLVVRRAD